ncbi:hypothetical protein LJC52_05155 [Bacteroidales bacterium OttesenSCG-928-A17]|nr:hypothetical protein [Bacteroidales bacterium OttesenSCG-928-A17]
MRYLFITLCTSMFFALALSEYENVPKTFLECLEEMGRDTISTLNDFESKYFNFYFQKDKETFDFHKKKIAFLKGNTGTKKSTKKEYFDRLKQFINKKGTFPEPGSEQLIILDEKEIEEFGYDAVIISLSKKHITNKEIIKRLKNLSLP